MLGIKLEEDSESHHNSTTTFSGVFFVLQGFDPVSKQKVRLKLINGGGVDVGHYDPVCTHVIVHQLVYDDPICVSARTDGKNLVTGLWVDHTFEVGMPVDPISVMYRPLKGKDGIPGANSLLFCLTGYQRQERDDIMTMVGLMGASFSKPLVATKVTHLICYKFEGEKYELANKIKRIKLVNHRWLEDCLKAWTILPEVDYNISGYDLEMMEAEAKDSEEEDVSQELDKKLSDEMKTVASPDTSTARGRVDSQLKDFSKTLPTSCAPKGLPHATNSDATVLGSGEDSISIKLNIPETDKRNANVVNFLDPVDHQDVSYDEPYSRTSANGASDLAGQPDAAKLSFVSYLRENISKSTLPLFEGGSRSNISSCKKPFSKTPTFTKEASDLANQPDSAKLNSISYSRKNIRKSPLSLLEGENISSRPKVDTDKVKTSYGFKIYSSEEEQSQVAIDTAPLKEEGNVSYGKSPKINRASKVCDLGSPSVSKVTKSYVPADLTKNASPRSGNAPYIYMAKENISGTEQKSFSGSGPKLKDPQPSFVESESMGLAIEHSIDNIVGEAEFVSIEADKPQRKVAHSDAAKFSSLSYSRKNIRKSPISVFEGENKSNVSIHPIVDTDKVKISDGFKVNLSEKERLNVANETDKVKISDGFEVNLSEKERPNVANGTALGRSPLIEEGNPLSGKRKIDVSYEKLKLPKINPDSKLCNTGSSSVSKVTKSSVSAAAVNADMDKNASPTSGNSPSDNLAKASPRSRNLELDKSSPDSISLKGNNDQSLGKPELKKAATNMTQNIGSRAKFGLRKVKNQKGSIYLDDTASASMVENNDCEKAEKLPPNICGDKGELMETNNTEKPTNGPVDKMNYTDDEIEPPVDKEEDQLNYVSEELAEEINAVNLTMNDKSEPTVPNTAKADGKTEATHGADEVGAKSEIEVDGNKNELDEPITSKGCELEKPIKALGKRKSIQPSLGKRKSKEKRTEEFEGKKKYQKTGLNIVKSSPSSKVKAEETVPLTDTSAEVEKENVPVGKRKSVPLVSGKRKSKEQVDREEFEDKKNNQKIGRMKKNSSLATADAIKRTQSFEKVNNSIDVEKENRPVGIDDPNVGKRMAKVAFILKRTTTIMSKDGVTDQGSVLGTAIMKSEPTRFILTGHNLQKKQFQQVIKCLRGKVCRDSHKWSYQATHLIYPDPLRRTEKFFAAAASGRWILKTDYLAACNKEGKFLAEEPYEWHQKGLSEDGAINLEAPRKWRLLRERTGHGALHGMRVIIYGECIAPSLANFRNRLCEVATITNASSDILKRVIKAGDGTILATSPPYTRFLTSGVDYAIVSPGIPRIDTWVQEFLKHEIPCVLTDYLVEYVCKPDYPLERHVQYNTQAWAGKSFVSLQSRLEEVVSDREIPENDVS